jgi:hypothetical protein
VRLFYFILHSFYSFTYLNDKHAMRLVLLIMNEMMHTHHSSNIYVVVVVVVIDYYLVGSFSEFF